VTRTLSEHDSKRLLARHGVPFLSEIAATDPDEAVAAADQLGYPVVAKLNGDAIAHKTERGLVRLNLGDAPAVRAAARELFAAARPEDGEVQVLVAPFVRGNRELICGLADDPQFGMTVLLGVGGVLAEALGDVVLRLVPLDAVDADEMLEGIATQALLGAFRGEPAIDRQALADVVLALSAAATAEPQIRSVDLNPLIIVDGRPVAVDALVEVDQ
jgi:succinyl-CoA synthetase beta subunit